MYNLLIIDDEVTVVNGLAYDIAWNELGIAGVYKAYNARQAIEYMTRGRIDIVISDIHMPDMDGLELAAHIRLRWPHAKIIFISGYDDFSFAQKAIDLRALSYITKPVYHEKVQETVLLALDEIRKDLVRTSALQIAARRLEEEIPLLVERYLNAWLVRGSLPVRTACSKLQSCNIMLGAGTNGLLLIVKADKRPDKEDALHEGVIGTALLDIVRGVLLKGEDMISFRDPEENLVILLARDDKSDLHQASQYIQGIAETFQASVHSTLDKTVSLFWSDIVELERMHETYARLLEQSRKSVWFTSGVIMGPENKMQSVKNEKIAKLNTYPTFSMLIESMQAKEAVRRLSDIFQEAERKINPENLLSIYFAVSTALLEDAIKKNAKLEEWAGEAQSGFFNFEKLGSMAELKVWCMETTRKYLEWTAKKEKNSANYLIQQAKKAIDERLGEDLSLDEIASMFYIHPNHLSRLFKEKEGITITEYRIKRRIEAAKELLRIPGTKVYEVAEKVGFGSVSSLNRIFKQGTGMTPKEFQNNRA